MAFLGVLCFLLGSTVAEWRQAHYGPDSPKCQRINHAMDSVYMAIAIPNAPHIVFPNCGPSLLTIRDSLQRRNP